MGNVGVRVGALDGLRGVAIILTFCVHYFGTYLLLTLGKAPDILSFKDMTTLSSQVAYALFRSHYGVYLFFVISGFLIGRIVVTSKSRSYSQFLKRRLLRIYPPFLFSLAAIVLFRITYQGGYDAISRPTLSGVLGNLVFLNGLPALGVQIIVPHNVTWSLFFELAFYLVLPISWLIGRAKIGLLVVSMIGLGLCYWAPLWTSMYIFTPLFFGAILACVEPETCKSMLDRLPQSILLSSAVFVASLWCFDVVSRHAMVWLISIPGTMLVAEAAYSNRLLSKALTTAPLLGLGRISYSFYLMHLVAMFGFMQESGVDLRLLTFPQVLLFGCACFFAASVVSYVAFLISEKFYFTTVAKPVSLSAGPVPAPAELERTAAT
jgi:peptidoglycan/LPS O-acetylase OafA/YrhL